MNIELRQIHKRFGPIHANNDITVRFPGGRIIGVLGENGAGKSTLMKILSGFQPADSGEIAIDGRVVRYATPQDALRHGVGMLQQDPLDVPAFSVIENFQYGLPGGFRLNQHAAVQKLRAVCARVGFDLDPDQPITQLTISQRQQLEIVRQLACGVRALILDEPTTGISTDQKAALFAALRQLAHHDGMSVLLVSHKLEDVIALCDGVVVLRGGRLVGTADMPITTEAIVALMFGQQIAPQLVQRQPPGPPVLALQRVTLRGRRVTIHDYTLTLHAGEVVGVAGLDGSGQELLLRACAGLVKPTAGRVRIAGRDLTGRGYRVFMAAGVAFSAAGRLEEGLVAGLTLTEHVALTRHDGAVIRWQAARSHTETQLKTYNVKGRPDSRIEALSGGNQQRMLMALMPPQPQLLALEQPTRGLDVDSARWIWTQLLERRANGAALLFTSSDLDEITAYSDRILVCYAGQIVEIPDARHTTIDELGRWIGGQFTAAPGEEAAR